MARELGCRVHPTLTELLGEEADLALVLAPHPFHAELAIAALRSGMHVLTEKPIAVEIGEADRMVAEADRCGPRRAAAGGRAGDMASAEDLLRGRTEELDWFDPVGERIAFEGRLIGLPEVAAVRDAWSLDLETEIEISGPRSLRFGSPTTEGRPLAGYAGLAWRGPEALRNAAVLLEGDLAGDDPMGAHSRWLAVVGGGVMVAVQHPDNPGVPNRWFVPTDVYPLVTSSPVFDSYHELGPGQRLRLRHRLLFGDGEWTAGRLAEELRPWLDRYAG